MSCPSFKSFPTQQRSVSQGIPTKQNTSCFHISLNSMLISMSVINSFFLNVTQSFFFHFIFILGKLLSCLIFLNQKSWKLILFLYFGFGKSQQTPKKILFFYIHNVEWKKHMIILSGLNFSTHKKCVFKWKFFCVMMIGCIN